MHEVSIIEQTLEIAFSQAQQQGATKIHRLKMRIGQMSSVVPEALEFAFDVVTKGTMAEGAILEIELVPVVCYCSHCQEKFQPQDWFYQCPNCLELSRETLSGQEIELSSLEVS
jgi:hydrogenase nickel incorporation protein HypA/HybF